MNWVTAVKRSTVIWKRCNSVMLVKKAPAEPEQPVPLLSYNFHWLHNVVSLNSYGFNNSDFNKHPNKWPLLVCLDAFPPDLAQYANMCCFIPGCGSCLFLSFLNAVSVVFYNIERLFLLAWRCWTVRLQVSPPGFHIREPSGKLMFNGFVFLFPFLGLLQITFCHIVHEFKTYQKKKRLDSALNPTVMKPMVQFLKGF